MAFGEGEGFDEGQVNFHQRTRAEGIVCNQIVLPLAINGSTLTRPCAGDIYLAWAKSRPVSASSFGAAEALPHAFRDVAVGPATPA